MDLERSTIIAAIKSADGNLGDAARALGCSRRTLTNRKRFYKLPRGKSGRRKRELPYGRTGGVLGALGVAGAVVGGVLVARHYRRG